MATEFDKKVAKLQNVLIPQAERAAGHALLPTERRTITTLIRESLVDGDPRKIAALKEWVTPKAPAVRSFTETGTVKGFLEQTPTAPTPAASAPKDRLLEERIRDELLQRCQVGRGMLGRALTTEEQNDLEATIRERFGAVFAGTAGVTEARSFGHAVMEGRLGPAKSPGLARAQARTAAEIAEDAALVPGATPSDLTAHFAQLARLPTVDSDEGFHAAMAAFAGNVSFGGSTSGR